MSDAKSLVLRAFGGIHRANFRITKRRHHPRRGHGAGQSLRFSSLARDTKQPHGKLLIYLPERIHSRGLCGSALRLGRLYVPFHLRPGHPSGLGSGLLSCRRHFILHRGTRLLRIRQPMLEHHSSYDKHVAHPIISHFPGRNSLRRCPESSRLSCHLVQPLPRQW